jgi:hypothetical protein
MSVNIPFRVQHSVKLEADRYAQRPENRITFPRSMLRRRQQRSQFAAIDKFDKIIGTPNQNSISYDYFIRLNGQPP